MAKLRPNVINKWVSYLEESLLDLADLKKLQKTTSSYDELNILDGVTATTGEINRVADPSITTVNAATYTILATDSIIHVTYTPTGTCTITWPTALMLDAFRVIIVDAGANGGNAGVNNITVATEGAETIDGDASWIINGHGDWIEAYSDGSNLFITG